MSRQPVQSFTCQIVDSVLGDRFSATVTVSKRSPIRRSLDNRHVEIADILITPISGQHFTYLKLDSWKKTAMNFPQAQTREKQGSHNHFVLFDTQGNGVYIVRNPMRQLESRRECSIWDLGVPFAQKTLEILKRLT